MYIVTGGAGFIGNNLVHRLGGISEEPVVVVDDMTDGTKFRNLVGARIAEYLDVSEFLHWFSDNKGADIKAVFHLGACSDTTEWNGRYMMENNYAYSKKVLEICKSRCIPFIYASSAAVYGMDSDFRERVGHEKPINVYGYSKALFDQYAIRATQSARSQIVGLRYFNVYGPREQHKGSMASVAFHHFQQMKHDGRLKLFEGCDGYCNGEQKRDFVYVDDVVDVKLWLLDNPGVSGVFNCGTGQAEPFNSIGQAVIECFGRGVIDYIPFPASLRGSYQTFTQADLSALRQVGCDLRFHTVSEGVQKYMEWLQYYGLQV